MKMSSRPPEHGDEGSKKGERKDEMPDYSTLIHKAYFLIRRLVVNGDCRDNRVSKLIQNVESAIQRPRLDVGGNAPPGWHWCLDWDGLLVGPGTPEWGENPKTCDCGTPDDFRMTVTHEFRAEYRRRTPGDIPLGKARM
jgi:hypothetical protein